MPYKTEHGSHFHMTFGCHNAVQPYSLSQGSMLLPCGTCCVSANRDGSASGTAMVTQSDTDLAFANGTPTDADFQNLANQLNKKAKKVKYTAEGLKKSYMEGMETKPPENEEESQPSVTRDDVLKAIDIAKNGKRLDASVLPLPDDVLQELNTMSKDDRLAALTRCQAILETPGILRESKTKGKNINSIDASLVRHARWTSRTRARKTKRSGVKNNEIAGISAELALADAFKCAVDDDYRKRGDQEVKDSLQSVIYQAIVDSGCRRPTRHTAMKGSAQDFEIEGGLGLSVKTNKQGSRMVCPQKTGQMTYETTRKFLIDTIGLPETEVPDADAPEFPDFYKQAVFDHLPQFLSAHLDGLFDCDALLYCKDADTDNSVAKVYGKFTNAQFDLSKISISGNKTVDQWNNSLSIRYDGVAIGSFQVEGASGKGSRKDMKFRFNFPNLMRLLEEGRIQATQLDAYKQKPDLGGDQHA